MKTCTVCKRSLDESLFWRESKTPSGLKSKCKTCLTVERNKYLIPTPTVEFKECTGCFELKPASAFRRAPDRRFGLRTACKDCEAEGRAQRAPVPRYDFNVLAALLGFGYESQALVNPQLTDEALGLRLGVSKDLVQAARRRGLKWATADEWACRAGFHPEIVWPGWLDRRVSA